VDQTLERPGGRNLSWLVVLFAAAVFIGCAISPPGLMDDVDAVQAQIARNMLDSGDFVTARLNGVAYLEKSPLKYWMIVASMAVFGPQDWAARLPLAISAVLLCWVVSRFAAWAFDEETGLYAGLILSTCVGLFLFTRILIPDVILTLTITLALWGFLRALDNQEVNRNRWAVIMAVSIGIGLLLKGLIAAVFPVAAAGLFLLITGQLFQPKIWWSRLKPIQSLLLILLVAAPWHLAATLANPPYFDLTFKSEPGRYRGFFWFYFMNEHVLRFLNLRHPRDYNTVPRHLFWLFHLLWFFPWTAYVGPSLCLKFGGETRAGKTRLLCLCWAGFLLTFFTFSTTQEYYSMPCYPALAMLLAGAMATGNRSLAIGGKILGGLCVVLSLAMLVVFFQVRDLATPGDIATALNQNPELYTLSLGHMADLTFSAMAYLKWPLLVAAVAFLLGGLATFFLKNRARFLATAAMMVLFFQAARMALVVFDPYLGSRSLAEAFKQAPAGTPIFDNQYYAFSSVFFYANTRGLLLNGRVNNLEYGSYAPNAPQVFIDDAKFAELWRSSARYYLFVEGPAVKRIESLVGRQALRQVSAAGGKFLFTNQ
jgi:4-amino-4-deoxy-L-arabinose transferase-like glycosyltransferase